MSHFGRPTLLLRCHRGTEECCIEGFSYSIRVPECVCGVVWCGGVHTYACGTRWGLGPCVLARAVSLLFQLHKDLEAIPIEEWCGELCWPTLVLSPSQVFTQVGGALVCCH